MLQEVMLVRAAEFFLLNKDKSVDEVLAAYCQALLATAEFRNLD